MDILVYFFICTTIILAYSTYNVMRKIEHLEGIIDEQDTEYFEMKKRVGDAIKEMRLIDSKEAFEKEEEVGQIFSQLLYIVEELGIKNEEQSCRYIL